MIRPAASAISSRPAISVQMSPASVQSSDATMNESNDNQLIEVKDLRTHFLLPQGLVRAVDRASFTIRRGKTLGVVGESGCGKSVTAQSILRIVPAPGKIVSGEILYRRLTADGGGSEEVVDLTKLDGAAVRPR